MLRRNITFPVLQNLFFDVRICISRLTKAEKMQILVGTKNAGKVGELRKLLADVPVELCSLDDFENVAEPEETGKTFAENADLKAIYYSEKTGLAALADDSGLEVSALNNAPGVYSARYAGKDSSNAEKIAKLLEELEKSESDDRSARFVCVISLTNEKGEIIFRAKGVCDGKIAGAPRGENGFGYDPIFIPEGFDETFGELSGAVKSRLSHRGKAIEKIIQFLRGFTTV